MPFQCLPNCGECCGVLPISTHLFLKHLDRCQVPPIKIHDGGADVLPETEDGWCVFLNRVTRQCAIYHDRPEVCRLFGSSEEPTLACPHLHPTGKRRSRANSRQIQLRTDDRLMNLLSIEVPNE